MIKIIYKFKKVIQQNKFIIICILCENFQNKIPKHKKVLK